MAEDARDAEGDAGGRREPDERNRNRRDADHLAELEDGAGCTEIWEHLADHREDDRSERDGDGPDQDRADREEADG